MRRSLTTLAGLAVGLILATHGAMRVVAPAWLPRWGYLLFAVLGLWSAGSIWVFVSRGPRWLRIAVGTLLAGSAVVGIAVPGSGFVAVLVTLASTVALLLVGLVLLALRAVGRRGSARLLLPGFVVMLAAMVILIVNIAAHPLLPAVPRQPMDPAEELRYLQWTDQLDRRTGRFILDASRDRARLERVVALDTSGAISTPEASLHAALVLLHGSCPEHYRRAYELAHAAERAGVGGEEALWKAAYDRWMLSRGLPQKYGTQLSVSAAQDC